MILRQGIDNQQPQDVRLFSSGFFQGLPPESQPFLIQYCFSAREAPQPAFCIFP